MLGWFVGREPRVKWDEEGIVLGQDPVLAWHIKLIIDVDKNSWDSF